MEIRESAVCFLVTREEERKLIDYVFTNDLGELYQLEGNLSFVIGLMTDGVLPLRGEERLETMMLALKELALRKAARMAAERRMAIESNL